MSIQDLFKEKTVLSYEVFPPKKQAKNPSSIYKTLDVLKDLNPDAISVTYGALGAKNNTETFKIAKTIKDYGVESIVHLPGIELTKADVLEKLDQLKALNLHNILALRGDLPEGDFTPGDFRYASDLISFIKENGDFNITAACYPEGHVDSPNIVEDIKNLRIKVESGVDHLITQLFLNNDHFYRFRERCALAGINVPIEAGIMPVTNKRQIEKMTSLCGVELPEKFIKVMNRYEDDPIAMRDAGIAYAIDQIVDLVTQGVDGIHLYTMNNPYIAKRIFEATHNLIDHRAKVIANKNLPKVAQI
ncbi:methylenetetrahydrofolate reductase [NAD(P)H] [Atopobacter sp. AH10]|uniref:methylenetetrahydrofolate reductase [NAD(P)H] n=1 Tax=Atopobacter sp. AH10 TaxID=2315861 RepID=UPI000EF25682|nr:methylenetetrahydrofolate reductase [NAD(P)H] [Atopobacter sp. AH10]RLK62674.1 methylenetetrahydrofolate reductase [NAD(P)H] [Atopobacter sp. AH10]